jgi:ankyrin repeat protein
LKTGGKYKEDEIARIISTTNSEDGATPLHIASKHGHTDVIRALLVSFPDIFLELF